MGRVAAARVGWSFKLSKMRAAMWVRENLEGGSIPVEVARGIVYALVGVGGGDAPQDTSFQ